MLQIKTNGQTLDLPGGFSIAIEDSSPIFNERGSQSIPATVPATRLNSRLLKFPYRIDSAHDPNNPEQTAQIIDGAYIRSGILNVTESCRLQDITFNVGFDNSTAYVKWQKKKLQELSGLPVRSMPPDESGPNSWDLDWVALELERIYREADPQIEDLAVFPLAVNKETASNDREVWEILNQPTANGLIQPTKVNRIIDGTMTTVTVPPHYGLSPFIRVWRVLEFIFNDLGLTIVSNPFHADRDLSRLVALNNCADSCCTNTIIYKDIMPDVTVEDFLNALWVRFGLVYNINYDRGTVDMQLLRDIIGRKPENDLSPFLSGHENVIYNAPQYVKLSAQTSIDGAAPSQERFEDFAKGLDTSHILLGTDVGQWIPNKATGRPQIPSGGSMMDWVDSDYDPDYTDPDYPDPEYPDPDDDRDDGRDDRDDDMSRSRSSRASSTTSTDRTLAYEYVTGTWYRLDVENGKVLKSSSSFFNWDPQPASIEPFELSSDDEFVPVIRVIYDSTAGRFNDMCPTYLFGSRHYHSVIKGSVDTDGESGSTPLAFLFAYTIGQKTIGRVTPEGGDGFPVHLDDGTSPGVSLLFQFSDGLFARYWRKFDEILRHGNRNVEVPARMSKTALYRMDMIRPVLFRGVRCLVNTASYSLPSGKNVAAELNLRTLDTQGHYDIKAEQNIPGFAAAIRSLTWKLVSETFGNDLDTIDTRQQAATRYIELSGYRPHGTEGDRWYVGPAGAVLLAVVRSGETWQNDPSLAKPVAIGIKKQLRYKASLVYDIYEVHDMAFQGDPDDWELDEISIGRVTVQVDYTVNLLSTWLPVSSFD